MSYHSTDNTTLIARRGYGGTTPTGLGGVLDSIGSFIKSGVSSAVDIYKSGQQSAGQAQAYQTIAQQQAAQKAGMPSWVAPVAIGGAALVLGGILLTRKRRNPARRHRRSRRRRR
jgi:LPXTG-motif cell wall-anchored protein